MNRFSVLLIGSLTLLAACSEDRSLTRTPATASAPAAPAPQPVAAGTGMRTGVVVADQANLRAAPNNRARRIALLPRGTTVDIVQVAGAWAKVRTAGEEGYVFARSLRPE